MHQEILMPVPRAASPIGPWAVLLSRAVAALALGAAVTFSANHTSSYGSIVFGVWALLQGAVLIVGAVRGLPSLGARVLLAQGVLGALIGAASIALAGVGLGALLLVVTAFAAVTGALELYRSIRLERGQAVARESLFVGALTALLAIVFLAIPPDGNLVVGLIGVYGIVAGVYLAIASVSLRLPAPRVEPTGARTVGGNDRTVDHGTES